MNLLWVSKSTEIKHSCFLVPTHLGLCRKISKLCLVSRPLPIMKNTWVSHNLSEEQKNKVSSISTYEYGTKFRVGKRNYCRKRGEETWLRLFCKLCPPSPWGALNYQRVYVRTLNLLFGSVGWDTVTPQPNLIIKPCV